MSDPSTHRTAMRDFHLADEGKVLSYLQDQYPLPAAALKAAQEDAAGLVEQIRAQSQAGLMEAFLAEYGLSTNEGVALMCLAEAMLRIPDDFSRDALIEDKITTGVWRTHLGQSESRLVNAATGGLMMTKRILGEADGVGALVQGAAKRLGKPVIRAAVGKAMAEMGSQFVLGESIEEALRRGQSARAMGFKYSFDMLGEAAMTAKDADGFFAAYSQAIARLAEDCKSDDPRDNPGISIKLSALHPRYEETQRARVMNELVPRTLALAQQAKSAGMGLNIDAEEADRLDLSLDVIEAVLRDPSLAGWDGFGVVVQAYGKRATHVLDWLYALAERHGRRLMVRLVKGAYWDTEIKRSQVEGLGGFPVFTKKAATDVSYLCCAQQLLGMTDRIYPQFATHNAHTVAAVMALSSDFETYEFQRLHGMGESLYELVLQRPGARCRIYAPVGEHKDLLAYLVRRLLENGANSSFVNQVVDDEVPVADVTADPFETLAALPDDTGIRSPADLFAPERQNSRGWDLHSLDDLDWLEAARAPFKDHRWRSEPLMAVAFEGANERSVLNPSDPGYEVGTVQEASVTDVDAALGSASIWGVSAEERAQVLNRAADLYEDKAGELFALLAREAGKTANDAIGELREAVDFLRYYAARALELEQGPRGVVACVSPWNFPLAIFTGQLSAALAAGNAVVAKPAESTSLVANLAVELLFEAGVPRSALQLLPGRGSVVGAALSSDPRVSGFCFTGSTATAQHINRSMAKNLSPHAPLIAETGGLNAMIVDSTALPEQAVRDILASAFQSAGQRCSALRILFVQEEIRETLLKMLFGAMDELVLGDPWRVSTDIGPIIDGPAKARIVAHIEAARAEGRVLKQLKAPARGHFLPPTVLAVEGMGDMAEEVFGPVLHVASYRARDLDDVVDSVNAAGYGLTFGMHSRINDRVDQVADRARVGNLYINRNQIGAIVGSQPFGGEGLSGTGPKAGGPSYVARFCAEDVGSALPVEAQPVTKDAVQALINQARKGLRKEPLSTLSLPGPTGESNELSTFGRGVILCLGPSAAEAEQQAAIAIQNGCQAVSIAPGSAGENALDGSLTAETLAVLEGFAGVVSWLDEDHLKPYRRALAGRDGALMPLITAKDFAAQCHLERHVCIDTTAAGGNASLLAASGQAS